MHTAVCRFRKIINTLEITQTFQYEATQPAFTDSKLTIETLEQGLKYVHS